MSFRVRVVVGTVKPENETTRKRSVWSWREDGSMSRTWLVMEWQHGTCNVEEGRLAVVVKRLR